jgi:hypothetical protein
MITANGCPSNVCGYAAYDYEESTTHELQGDCNINGFGFFTMTGNGIADTFCLGTTEEYDYCAE